MVKKRKSRKNLFSGGIPVKVPDTRNGFMGSSKKSFGGFDKAFGLGGFDFGKNLNPELSLPFANAETEVPQSEIGFGRSFFEEDSMSDDPLAPEIISDDNIEEPADSFEMEDQFNEEVDGIEDRIAVDFGVPDLVSAVKEVSIGKRIPKFDRNDGMSREARLESNFLKTRAEMLETGANPLSPEEEDNFRTTRAQRNFGTTGRSGGRGLGRF